MMEDLNINATCNLFEIFIDLKEISESIFEFRMKINEIIQENREFPNLNSIINKTLNYEIFTEKIAELEKNIKESIHDFYNGFKNEVFSKYNIDDLEKFIKENFGYLFSLENFKLLRKYPQNRIKKILYEDNSIYTGQYIKNNYNKDIRHGFGYYELFPSNDIYLGIFENDNFSKGVFIKNSNNFYIGNFLPADMKFYKFEGMTISLSSCKVNISFGSIDIKNNISIGDFFLMEDDKIEYFNGQLVNDEKACEEGLLVSAINMFNPSDISYTIIKGEFLNDIPIKNFKILKPEFHVINIETDGNASKPIKGYVNFSKINRGIYNGEVEFDDYSFFPSNKGNILYEKNTFYFGEFFSGKRSGNGTFLAFKGDNKYLITEGFFVEDQLNQGKLYNDILKFSNSEKKQVEYIFDGKFENNQFKSGTLLYDNGDKYVGDFNDNKRHGEGTYYYLNGSYYTGEWKNNLKHGKGKYFDKNNNMLVKGVWENNKIDNLFQANEE